jgi:hypothetical protein
VINTLRFNCGIFAYKWNTCFVVFKFPRVIWKKAHNPTYRHITFIVICFERERERERESVCLCYVCLYVCTYVCVHVCNCAYMYYVGVYVCMYACMYGMYVCEWVRACACVCVCVELHNFYTSLAGISKFQPSRGWNEAGCTEDSEIFGATANILFARATWRPGFMQRCTHI